MTKTNSILTAYQQQLSIIENMKKHILKNIVASIKAYGRPIHIGNIMYYYTCYKGEEVPTYCYVSDFENGGTFLPIYDEEDTNDFGWRDFKECCRIFDVIEDKILKK